MEISYKIPVHVKLSSKIHTKKMINLIQYEKNNKKKIKKKIEIIST